MMSRMLFPRCAVTGLVLAGLLGNSHSGLAQPPAPQTNTAPRTNAAAAPRSHARPAPQQVTPQLQALLETWSQRSAMIKKLQGQHFRFVYDQVFKVEKRASGKFYYESPSKGRIDLEPAKIANGQKSDRVDKKTGAPYKLQPERPERWVCDGKSILAIADSQKQADVYPIPEEAQGQNIMDGPLPFLFGMPPEKAKRRYQMQILRDTPQQVILKVLPRLQVDAANWQEAKVILNKQYYLPQAVQLIDPTGNLETVYTFTAFKVNEQCNPNLVQTLFGADTNPFAPKLPKDYKTKVHQRAKPREPGETGPRIPAVVNFPWKEAKARLEQAGASVKILPGRPAPQQQLQYVVYQQNPPANAPLKQGQLVEVTVYDKPAAGAPVPQNPPAGNALPNLAGMYWKDAQKQLEPLGVTVKFKQGQTAANQQQLYAVYQQLPAAGTPVKQGMTVELTVFTAPKQ